MKEVWPSRCKMKGNLISNQRENMLKTKLGKEQQQKKAQSTEKERACASRCEEMSVWQFVVSLAAWVCPLSAMKGGSKRKAGSSLIFRLNESKEQLRMSVSQQEEHWSLVLRPKYQQSTVFIKTICWHVSRK